MCTSCFKSASIFVKVSISLIQRSYLVKHYSADKYSINLSIKRLGKVETRTQVVESLGKDGSSVLSKEKFIT